MKSFLKSRNSKIEPIQEVVKRVDFKHVNLPLPSSSHIIASPDMVKCSQLVHQSDFRNFPLTRGSVNNREVKKLTCEEFPSEMLIWSFAISLRTEISEVYKKSSKFYSREFLVTAFRALFVPNILCAVVFRHKLLFAFIMLGIII